MKGWKVKGNTKVRKNVRVAIKKENISRQRDDRLFLRAC